METDANEWRFQWIVDARDGRKLYQIEHETRSMKRHLFGRPLVNRNHGITNMTYVSDVHGHAGRRAAWRPRQARPNGVGTCAGARSNTSLRPMRRASRRLP